MSNRHTFETSVAEQRQFSSLLKSERNFESLLNFQRQFESIIDGYSVSDFLTLKFVSINNISISSMILSDGFLLSFSGSPIMQLDSRYISISQTPPLSFSNAETWDLIMTSEMDIGSLEFIQNKFMSVVDNTKVIMEPLEMLSQTETFEINPTVREYFLLNEYSGSLLTDMDSSNLSDLEYGEI